jgi:predicted RecB family nuclease
LARCVDLHKWVTHGVILPIENYTLKLIARWVGFEWRDAQANGAQAICWYSEWLKTGDRQLLESIIVYNEDDCRATWQVKNWLSSFLESQQIAP